MSAVARATPRQYWERSRSHRYSLLFALPLLLAYEFFEAVAPVHTSGGVIRNGADVLLTDLFIWMLGPRGPFVFIAVVIGFSLWLVGRDRDAGPLRLRTFAMMLAESAGLAMTFGLVVGALTMRVVGPLRSASIGSADGGTALERITLSLGAGLYEELLFRVVIVSALATGFRFLGFGRMVSGAVATVLGALIFSAFHYVGPLGDSLTLESFVFRAIAGVAFSALYLTRGFGITAWIDDRQIDRKPGASHLRMNFPSAIAQRLADRRLKLRIMVAPRDRRIFQMTMLGGVQILLQRHHATRGRSTQIDLVMAHGAEDDASPPRTGDQHVEPSPTSFGVERAEGGVKPAVAVFSEADA